MKIDNKVKEILSKEAPAAIVTSNGEGPHLVGTWNSFIQVMNDETLAIPAGGMSDTERNVRAGSEMQLLVGSREVQGKSGPGAGYRLTGKPSFETSGPNYDKIKSVHNWARGALVLKVNEVEQLT